MAGREVAAGHLRRIARGIYTRNTSEPLEGVVRRNWPTIAGGLFPGAVVVDRSAFELAPAADGSLFLDVGPERKSGRRVRLPGLTLATRAGPGPVKGDEPFMTGLHLSGRARAYLDNLRPARAGRDRLRRALGREALENKLDELAARQGEGALNRLRDDAAAIAARIDAERELAELDRLIGALLGSRDAELVSTPARARGAGIPYDGARVDLFALLQAELLSSAAPIRAERAAHDPVFAFFEAYFSNFIEGTEFPLSEAEAIVFEGRIPANRPKDAHDVLGTFALVNDPERRGRVPTRPDEMLDLLRENHRVLLGARPEARPGEFKQRPNRAGSTVFVEPNLVAGTLRQGLEHYRTLPDGFPRAVFAMFLVAEVHPFDDGNGRIARVMMNAELSAAAEQRIVIPTAYRNNYLQALRALTHNRNPRPLVRVLDFAQRYSGAIDWSSVEHATRELSDTNALLDPGEAEEAGRRLRLPGSAPAGGAAHDIGRES